MDDIIAEFLAETNDSLGELDNDLLQLEQDPNNDELISKIFRILHTIKGTCGFLGLSRLEKVAHKGEDVLGLFRDKKLEVTPASITLILESFDTIKDIIAGIEATGQEPAGDDSDLIARLEAVYNSAGDAASNPEIDMNDAFNDPFADLNAGIEQAINDQETNAEAEFETVMEAEDSVISEDDDLASISFDAVVEEVEETSDDDTEGDLSPSHTNEKTPEVKQEQNDHVSETSSATPAAATSGPVSNQTLRVNVDVLEDLMTMVSELVLTRNQLLQISRQNKDSEFSAPLQRLNHVVSDLQEGVMKTRMQPIGNAWQKLPRIVRDVCKELNKKIDLEMLGQDTELDRQILDMIKDPLTHMVRNSADHGVETPAERLAKGKPETGRIVLNAFHQGGHIIIEISDDGKGLSLDRIKKKIVANGLATEEQLATMSVQNIQQHIFHAGFSTAEKVTAVSGRGVGMDVVRSNIEKIGGSIELRSEEDKGTTFTIKIPLTLAIVSALIVGVSGQRFAIPQLTVSELVLAGKNNGNQIEKINNAPVLRLRDKLLPLISLSELLQLKPQALPEEENGDKKDSDTQYIVVTKSGSTEFGVIVDHVYDLEEIVIKPLSENLKSLSIFSGNTILGDGCVIMILDPSGILKSVDLQEVIETKDDTQEEELLQNGKENLLLLFRAGDETLKATPVNKISRLEEIETKDIEYSNGRPVIQYLGHLMPVFDLQGQITSDSERRPLIILRHEGRNMGLLANQILDITKYYGDIQTGHHNAICDSIIINEHAADVINAEHLTAQGVVIKEDEAVHG